MQFNRQEVTAWSGMALLLSLAIVSSAQGQETRKCRFRLRAVGDSGRQVKVATDSTNYYAGGGVRITCDGTAVSIESDSIAAYAGKIVQFIGSVHYKDSTVTMDADNGTYFKDGERWEARGSVNTTNLATGSTLVGPSLDYLRAVTGVRDTVEIYATGRPTIHYIPKDSAGTKAEPYVIVADRFREKGEDQVWAGGKVTVDRSDLVARGDSLQLRTGKNGQGALIGGPPSLRGIGKDTFDIAGKRIDFTLNDKDLTGVTAIDSALAVTKDMNLIGDTISIALKDKKAERSRSWGRKRRPVGLAGDYELRGDSLVIETPDGKLSEVRAFFSAWVGAKPDSGTGKRDWVAGDTVIVTFNSVDSAGKSVTHVRQLEAQSQAKSFYRAAAKDKTDKNGKKVEPSLNYARADRIVVHMATDGDGSMERVDLYGHVDGVQLEPGAPGPKPKLTMPGAGTTAPSLPGLKPGGPGQ